MRLGVTEDLAPFVEHLWSVRWDRRGLGSFAAETLPHPSVHVVLERGASAVSGVHRARFTRVLEGVGEVFAIKFRPGGFRPFVTWPVSDITDRVLPLRELGEDWAELEERALGREADAERAAVVEAFLRARLPARDPLAETAAAVVGRILERPELRKVEDVVRATGMSERELQRLFREYVGVSPKWVIQRYRLHEALARIEEGGAFDFAALAQELGYFDQAHFTRDFRALVGVTPGAYARRLR